MSSIFIFVKFTCDFIYVCSRTVLFDMKYNLLLIHFSCYLSVSGVLTWLKSLHTWVHIPFKNCVCSMTPLASNLFLLRSSNSHLTYRLDNRDIRSCIFYQYWTKCICINFQLVFLDSLYTTKYIAMMALNACSSMKMA